MKRINQFSTFTTLRTAALLATALVAGAALIVNAQTWETVFPNAASGNVAGVGGDIGTDANGNLYAVGRQIAADGSSVAVVQGSADQGTTWHPLDQYTQAGLSYAHNRAFAVDHLTGSLFAGGNLNNHLPLPNGNYEFDALWFIREWNPVTGTWSTAEDYSALLNDVGQASCADIKVSPDGDVYATGGSQRGWVVRKRPAGAATFSTVDADYSGQSSGSGRSVGFHPNGAVFVVGDVNGIWTVRRSTNNGVTWETVDSLFDSTWTQGSAQAVAIDGSGMIYVCGQAYDSRKGKNQGNRWVVRRSPTGDPGTWSMSDEFRVGGIIHQATGIVLDPVGQGIYVCGVVEDSTYKRHWLVRKFGKVTKVVKGKTVTQWAWTTSDDFQLASGLHARANGITRDALGNLYVTGQAEDANRQAYWVVRKLTP